MINESVIDVVEHLVVLLKDSRRMGKEECQMLLSKLDRARAQVREASLLHMVEVMECDCEECRKERGE